jgi:hypothetical protein
MTAGTLRWYSPLMKIAWWANTPTAVGRIMDTNMFVVNMDIFVGKSDAFVYDIYFN